MSLDKPENILRNVLEKRQASLHLQFFAANEQHDQCLDSANKVVLKLRIASLKKELDEVENELSALEKQQEAEKYKTKLLKQKICQIDFKDQVKRFNDVRDKFGRRGGTGIFLLQDSHAFAGELLVKRLQEDLSSDASGFDHYPVGFSSGISLDETGILVGLSNHLKLNSKESYGDDELDEIISLLCKSLQTKKVKFVELKEWHKLPSPDSVLKWLRDKFYPRLNAQFVSEASKQDWRKAYIFVIIVSDNILPESCVEEVSCITKLLQMPFQTLENVGGIVDIRLNEWSQDDVEDWLENVGLSDAEIVETAKRLCLQGRGYPRMICDAIEKEFCTLPNSD